MRFNKKLKELRKETGISQKELSNKLGKTQSNYSLWELGKTEPNITDLKKLADFFGCTVDYLLDRENEEGIVYIIGNKLSKDEEKLIDKIRQLSTLNKEILYRYVNFLLNEQKK